jgi:hypothetical protein
MKPKRYTSADKLGRAWLAQEFSGSAMAGRSGGYKIVADPNTIWNGDKTQVLVRRNPKLNLVLALQRGSASLGKSALACIKYATEIPAVYKWNYSNRQSVRTCVSERVVPTPLVFLNSLEDEALSSCDLATLQPIVLKCSTQHLKSLFHGYRNHTPGNYQYTYIEDAWAAEKQVLQSVGLDIPKEYEEKKIVAIATRRLRTNTHHI